MDSGTLSDAGFASFVKDRFELVRIEMEHHAAAFERLQITDFPSIVILGPDGKELARMTGDPGPTELQAKLAPYAKGA